MARDRCTAFGDGDRRGLHRRRDHGHAPVAEMQFADFISCAWDQLVTVAAKQFYRVGTPIPIVVRLPSGGGFSAGRSIPRTRRARSRTSRA